MCMGMCRIGGLYLTKVEAGLALQQLCFQLKNRGNIIARTSAQ